MKLLVTAAVGALALAGCSQGDNNNVAADNGFNADQTMMTNDPATTDLNLEANATAVDQAVNQTDQQSDLGNAVDGAANGAANTVE